MSQKIYYGLNVMVDAGPKLAESTSLEVDAYDMIKVTIKEEDDQKEVQLVPADAEEIKFLMMVSSWYGDSLKYCGDLAKSWIPLADGALMLIGSGAVGLIPVGAPRLKSLFFQYKNIPGYAPKEVEIEILVGRNATP
jgi:hypothetical protein